jgi:hypothetical protein
MRSGIQGFDWQTKSELSATSVPPESEGVPAMGPRKTASNGEAQA